MYTIVSLLFFLCFTQVYAQNMDKKQSAKMTENSLERRGFSIQPYTALSFCLPSGKADCSEQFPGALLGGSLEYRRRYVGFSLDGDYGFLSILDESDKNIGHHMMHLGVTLKGYYPWKETIDFWGGIGLGYGYFEIFDDSSSSKISWESLWSDFRWMLGASMSLFDKVSLDVGMVFTHHLGGKICIIYQGAGPCTPREDLDPSAQDIILHLHLTSGIRYTF